MVRSWLVVLPMVLAFGCDGASTSDGDADADTDGGGDGDGDGDDGEPPDWPEAELPRFVVLEPGVRREVFEVEGVAPPANPETGEETPAELDAIRVLRYRLDEDPPAPARAVVVAVPGYLSGGAAFDGLARSLVRRGGESGEVVEVWAIDRRSNLLEDLRGMDAAEALGDAEVALGYYFGDHRVSGEPFPGFLGQEDLSYVSEWGLAMLVEDLRRVIALVPADSRRGHVFLMGHSLGASISEAYGAWRFDDGLRGVEELAGVILVDGALADVATTEAEYRDGAGTGLFARPGLAQIRGGEPVSELPFFGVEVYARAEILALRTLFAPGAVQSDEARDELLSALLGLPGGGVPAMTNRAALGWGFDAQSQPLAFAAASLGQSTGGAVESYGSLLGGATLLHPTDPEATYDWVDALEADPVEVTPLEDFARSLTIGTTNFMEWYFPARLALDVGAVGGEDLPEDGYQAEEGLAAFDRELMDAPVLAVAAALVGPDGYDSLPTRLGPAVGEGRPHAGVSRDDPSGLGLRVVDATALSHVDPLSGADLPQNPAPDAVETFLLEHVAEMGTVSIPAM